MKTMLFAAALIGLSATGASACDYGNTSASVEQKMTVASIDTARQDLQSTQEAVKEDAQAAPTQPQPPKDDKK
jgi:hypothetical protein